MNTDPPNTPGRECRRPLHSPAERPPGRRLGVLVRYLVEVQRGLEELEQVNTWCGAWYVFTVMVVVS